MERLRNKPDTLSRNSKTKLALLLAVVLAMNVVASCGSSASDSIKETSETAVDGNLLAYACFILTEDGKYAVMDYFAVIPNLRGRGTGSAFLHELKEWMPAGQGVFIEAESPDTAKTDEEVAIRQRRIHFYLSNGAELTGSKCLLFGVDYIILYISCGGNIISAEQVHHAVEDVYREIYRPAYGRLCKLYKWDKKNAEQSTQAQ